MNGTIEFKLWTYPYFYYSSTQQFELELYDGTVKLFNRFEEMINYIASYGGTVRDRQF